MHILCTLIEDYVRRQAFSKGLYIVHNHTGITRHIKNNIEKKTQTVNCSFTPSISSLPTVMKLVRLQTNSNTLHWYDFRLTQTHYTCTTSD